MRLPLPGLAVLLRRAEVFPGVQELVSGNAHGWAPNPSEPRNASLVHDALQCRAWGAPVADQWNYDQDCCAQIFDRTDGHDGAKCERGQYVPVNHTCAEVDGVRSQHFLCLDLPPDGLVHDGSKCMEWGYPLSGWNHDADCCAWVEARHDGELGAGCADGYRLEVLFDRVCMKFEDHHANSYLCLGERDLSAGDPNRCLEWGYPVPQMWNYDDDCCAWIYGREDGQAGAMCGDGFELKVRDTICYEWPSGLTANYYECIPVDAPDLNVSAAVAGASSGAVVGEGETSSGAATAGAAPTPKPRFTNEEHARALRGNAAPEQELPEADGLVRSVMRKLMKEADDRCFFDYPSCEPYCLSNCAQGFVGHGCEDSVSFEDPYFAEVNGGLRVRSQYPDAKGIGCQGWTGHACNYDGHEVSANMSVELRQHYQRELLASCPKTCGVCSHGSCMPRQASIYSHGLIGCFLVLDPTCSVCMLSPTMYPNALQRVECPATKCAFSPSSTARPAFHARNASDAALKLGKFDPARKVDATHEGPTPRPFATRFAEARSCYQHEWSIRKGDAPEDAGCDGLGHDACDAAAQCDWRVASPAWFNDLRDRQTPESAPYLR